MKIAVLSGKGGSGKTMVAVNLAVAAQRAIYADCDVEAPNGHLFFKPSRVLTTSVTVQIPQLIRERCTGCRKCVSFCRFNALAYINQQVMIFEDICHACGGCVLVCPEEAFHETTREIGKVTVGAAGSIRVISGDLNPGESEGIPVIRSVINQLPGQGKAFIDSPPGTSCSVMESVRQADYCLLVAESTVFGLHNLMMVHELVQLFQKPHGILLNKCLEGENPSETYAREQHIPIVGRIPYDTSIGRLNAQGKILAQEDRNLEKLFAVLLERLEEEVSRHETVVGSQR